MAVISGLMRRLGNGQGPGSAGKLLNDTVAAARLRVLNALADAQTAVETALRSADFNPREPG